jgi:glycosyltransferase involved in cell wall biosynthesis
VYRVEHAAAGLVGRGFEARTLPLDDSGAAEAVAAADVVTVFRGRWGEAFERVHAAARARGVPLVIDTDDLLFDEGVWRRGAVALLDHLAEEERARWIRDAALSRAALAAADAAVVTTPALAAAAGQVLPHVHVVPNGVDGRMIAAADAARRLPKPSAADGLVRVGFASGTPTHHRDFATVAPALAALLARRAEVRLVIVGILDVGDMAELRPHAARIEIRPRVPLRDLETELARFDVNLAPLEVGNPFCECKSAIRVTAAALVGVPSVAAAVGALPDAVVDGRTGIVAADAAGWLAALEALVADPARRAALGEAARLDVAARFGPEAGAAAFERAYRAILAAGRR